MAGFLNSSGYCIAGIDRVMLRSEAVIKDATKMLPTFRTESDYAQRNANADFFVAPYGRFRRMINDATKTRLFIQYRPRFRGLAALRVAIVPDDRRGLQRREVEIIAAAFAPSHFFVVEVALDFQEQKT
jgi:hypothetical protein